MEEEKKKKRNKKKKSKQTKITDDVTNSAGQSASMEQNHVTAQNHHNQVSEAADVKKQNSLEQKADVDQDGRQANGTGGAILAEAEKSNWLDKEASLEETIKQLQKAKDIHIEKEAGLEMKNLQLQSEKGSWLQKEASSEETIKQLQKAKDIHIEKEAGLEMKILQLQSEKGSWLQKEASLEETIKQLQKEKDTHIEKEAVSEMKNLQLQSEKGSWLQKEAGFNEKIDQLIDETATLSLKGVSLEEKIKQLERERESWVQQENSNKETIASLNDDNTRLRSQVMELEETRNTILQENQQLMENISVLQSQIQDHERSVASAHSSSVTPKHASENEDLNSQIEDARALVEKLVTENAELVEKVNELYTELDRRKVTAPYSSVVGSDLMVGTAETACVADPVSETSELRSKSGKGMESPEDIVLKDVRNGVDHVIAKDFAHVADPMFESSERTFVSNKGMGSLEDVAFKDDERKASEYVYTEDTAIIIQNSPETIDSEEIVQISLDENEVRDLDLQTIQSEEKADVPITDAPLIGAPFRLISFVARYVSGADLVNKSSVN